MTYTFLKEQLITRTELKHLSAEELMIIYQQHSPEEAYAAFNELYTRFSHKVFSFVMKKLKNQADAEDLLQKIFIKIHTSKQLYKAKFKFEQWLFVIARTSVLDHLRAGARYKNRLTKISTETENSSDDLNTEVFKSLSEDQKEMLEMKYIDDLSYQEMASLLNKSETSLRKTVSRLMIHLRKGDA